MQDVLSPGTLVGGRYRIGDALGSGGMGTTYAAEDTQGGQRVAVKALNLRSLGDWKALELFEREARVLENLDHPSVPRYIDYVALQEGGETFYLVQELVEGQSLAQRVVAGWRPDEAELRRVARAMLETLVYLHGRQPPVVHRDIKPENVIMRPDGALALVDFGAVKDTLRGESTFASTVVGTYGYMAPEQFRGHGRPSSDLYGVGATLVHLMTHQSPSELPQKRLRIDFRAACQISEKLAAWLDELIEPAPEDRFSTAADALAALDRLERGGERSPAPDDPFAMEAPEPAWEGFGNDELRVPAGSRVKVAQEGRQVDVSLPPVGLRGMNGGHIFMTFFAVFWLSFIAVWTGGASMAVGVAGIVGIIFPLFSIPFWLVGFGMLWGVLSGVFGGQKLTLDPERFAIKRQVLGITYSTKEGRTADIDSVTVATPTQGFRTKGKDPTPCLTIHEGITKHQLGGQLTSVENEWLQGALNDYLTRAVPRTLPAYRQGTRARQEAKAEVEVSASARRR